MAKYLDLAALLLQLLKLGLSLGDLLPGNRRSSSQLVLRYPSRGPQEKARIGCKVYFIPPPPPPSTRILPLMVDCPLNIPELGQSPREARTGAVLCVEQGYVGGMRKSWVEDPASGPTPASCRLGDLSRAPVPPSQVHSPPHPDSRQQQSSNSGLESGAEREMARVA